jgi:hypothetical protein
MRSLDTAEAVSADLNQCREQPQSENQTSVYCRGIAGLFSAAVRGGRDVRKGCFLLLPVVFSVALAGAQVGPAPREPEPNFSNAVVGSSLTCTPQRALTQSHTFVVPQRLLEEARLKARLLILLRDSLYDDANGIINIAREKEIKKLANKLKSEISE